MMNEELNQDQARPQQGELATQGRSVKMYMTQEGKSRTFVTNALTWGEFQSEIDGDFRNKEVVIKEGRHSLSVDSAELPKGNFTLFVYPKQSKSGASPEVEDLGYNKGRSVANYLNKKFNASIDLSGSKEVILDSIDDVLIKEDLELNEVLKDLARNPNTRAKKTKATEPVKEVVEKKSLASKLAAIKEKKVVKKLPASEVQKDTFPQQHVNSGGNSVPSRVDIHIHISGVESLASAMKLAALLPWSTQKAEIADRLLGAVQDEVKSQEQDRTKQAELVESLRVSKELEEKEKLEREEKEKEEKAIREEKEKQDWVRREQQRKEEEELSREANDIGRQLKQR